MFTIKKHRLPTSIADLDNDTLVEIICRLETIKHIVSCKSVSKLWHSLISTVCIPRITSSPVYGLLFNTSPSPPAGQKGPWCFASLKASHSELTSNTSLVESCLGATLPFRPSANDFLDCCNGLLLFFDPSSMHYYVSNPSTQQCTAIPNSPFNDSVPVAASLLFDPHYKVVHISRAPSATMNIFSPVTRQWASYNLYLKTSIVDSPWSPRSASLDGSFYRLSVSGHLLKFDVNQAGVRAFELPEIVARKVPIGSLGVSRGTLHYAWDDRVSRSMVWEFIKTDHTYEWVLKHTISLKFFNEHPLCSNLHIRRRFSVYAFHPTSDLLFVGNYVSIFSYDPETKTLEDIIKVGKDERIFSGQYIVYPFSVNLTPLDALSQSTIEKSADGRSKHVCVDNQIA